MKKLVFILILLFPALTGAVGNQTIHPVPSPGSSQFKKDGLLFWQNELPSIIASYFPVGWVSTLNYASSGLHSTSATCTSPSFTTEAFTAPTTPGPARSDHVYGSADANGNATASTINYLTAGVPGCTSGASIVRVAVCSISANSVGNFHRYGTSNYFLNYIDLFPSEPSGCTDLFDATISSGAITSVQDRRRTSPSSSPNLSEFTEKLETITGIIFVSMHATGGTGAAGDPWTGWESVFNNFLGKRYYFTLGYFSTSTALVLNTPHSVFTNNTGYVTIEGAGMGSSIVMWLPNGSTPSESVPATAGTGVKTWLTIGAVGLQAVSVNIRDLTVASTDLTTPKRAFHFIDLRNSILEGLSNTIPGTYWHDTAKNSIGIHVEGRGQNTLRHLYMYSADYPMVLDGTPNEGGACYPTPSGACEFDTNTLEDISLEVFRGFPPTTRCTPNPNLLIGKSTLLNRNHFRQINMNGGSSGIIFHGINQFSAGHNLFEAIFWEDPCPLDPSILGAGRVAAGVSPSTLFDDDRYVDNTALQPASAWGYGIGIDMSNAGPQSMIGLHLININFLPGGNGISLHRVSEVTIKGYHSWGNGLSTHSYPGQRIRGGPDIASPNDDCPPAVGKTGVPLNNANKAVVLDLSGVRVGGPPYTSFPVICESCAAGGETRVDISTDLSITHSSAADPVFFQVANNCNIGTSNVFPSTIYAAWDSIKDTATPGTLPGTQLWTPRLVDAADHEPTYTFRQGIVTVSIIGASKVINFSLYMVINSKAGMTLTDVAMIKATPGDNWSLAYCPIANCITTQYSNALTTSVWTGITFLPGSVNTASYTSGGTIAGAIGETCACTAFNTCTGVTATIPLTAANAITAGTGFALTNAGSGCTAAPTSCTLGNGSATCSGTATISTTTRPAFTQLTADIQGSDDRIILRQSGSGQAQQGLLVSQIATGATIAISGSFVVSKD